MEREPAPIFLDTYAPPNVRVSWMHYPWQNVTRITRKCEALTQLYGKGGHVCEGCSDPIAPQKRIDARFCSERCRKRAARKRRAAGRLGLSEKAEKP